MSSIHRINPKAGWCNEAELSKGPNGRNLCRQCGKEVPKGRRTFCSSECVDSWRLTTDPGFVRRKVWERDHGICAACGLDTDALQKSIADERWTRSPEMKDKLLQHGMSKNALYPGDFWQADHIIEVVNGGGCCGLENYQTLCTGCHKRKTAELARRRKSARNADKMELFR